MPNRDTSPDRPPPGESLELFNISDLADFTGRSIPSIKVFLEGSSIKPYGVSKSSGRPLYTRAQAERLKEETEQSMRKPNGAKTA